MMVNLSLGRIRMLSGLFSFRGVAQMLGRMPRYFFILVYPNRVIGDPRGTALPSARPPLGPLVQ